MLGWMRRNRKKKNYITNIKKEKILGVLGFLIGPQRKQTRRYRQIRLETLTLGTNLLISFDNF